MDIISFKCDATLARKLKNGPSKNRMFNTKSEIIRTVLTVYFDDPIVKRAVHQGIQRKYVNLIDEDLI